MSNEKYGQSNTLSQVLQDKEKLNENLNKIEIEKGEMVEKIKELNRKNYDHLNEIKLKNEEIEEKSSKLNDANEKIRRLTEDAKKLKDSTKELESMNKN